MGNTFQIKDRGIKRFLICIISVQIAFWGIFLLDTIGLQVPILRQFLGFIYLTFVPGVLILRILRLHKLTSIETLLYTVGLSIALLMFTGFFMNICYPLFGISKPISTTSSVITISVIVLILSILSFVRDKDFFVPSSIEFKDILSPRPLLFCFIPFFAVLGVYFVNYYHNNFILLLLVGIVAVIPLIIVFKDTPFQNLYPLIVVCCSIFLLYHFSLISNFVLGFDIHHEYYLASLVLKNSFWDLSIPYNTNGMLSIVILAPFYSLITDMDLTYVFKVFYPLIFSLVPLGLYRIYQKQSNDKIAFLACFFFMSLFTFYTEMLGLARQQIAELFLVLLVLVILDDDTSKRNKFLLFIVFSFSLAVSHYGLAYICMLCFICAWLILRLMGIPAIQRVFKLEYRDNNDNYCDNNNYSSSLERDTINWSCLLLFIIFTLTWYMYISGSSTLNTIVRIESHIISSIFTEFLSTEAAQGLQVILEPTSSPLHDIAKYLHLLTQFFISVGILSSMLNFKRSNFNKEYLTLSWVNYLMLLCGITVPYFASSLNTTRLYHIVLLFLSLFCVRGGKKTIDFLSRLFVFGCRKDCSYSRHKTLEVLAILFAVFFLFNSGWIYEVTNDVNPTSIPLSLASVKKSGKVKALKHFYGGIGYIQEQDFLGTKWLREKRDKSVRVFADYANNNHVLRSYGMMSDVYDIGSNVKHLEKNSYFYFGYLNVCYDLMRTGSRSWCKVSENPHIFGEATNKLYSNGGCEIWAR